MADASVGSRWLRCAVDANSERNAATVLTVLGIGSAAPRLPPGAITIFCADNVISAPAEKARWAT